MPTFSRAKSKPNASDSSSCNCSIPAWQSPSSQKCTSDGPISGNNFTICRTLSRSSLLCLSKLASDAFNRLNLWLNSNLRGIGDGCTEPINGWGASVAELGPFKEKTSGFVDFSDSIDVADEMGVDGELIDATALVNCLKMLWKFVIWPSSGSAEGSMDASCKSAVRETSFAGRSASLWPAAAVAKKNSFSMPGGSVAQNVVTKP